MIMFPMWFAAISIMISSTFTILNLLNIHDVILVERSVIGSTCSLLDNDKIAGSVICITVFIVHHEGVIRQRWQTRHRR